jgi:hypothetical protein
MVHLKDKGTAFLSGFINATLDDLPLQDILRGYKRRVAGTYRPLMPDDIMSLPASRYFASEKIDGELWFLNIQNNLPSLISPNGRVLHGDLPVFGGLSGLPNGLLLAGELFVQRPSKRSRVGDLSSFFANPNFTEEATLAFHVFDVARGPDNLEQQTYKTRLQYIQKVLPGSGQLRPIECIELETPSQVSKFFAEKTQDDKAEGIIVRSDVGMTYKVKPIIELDALIIAFTTRLDSPTQVRSILLALAVDESSYQIIGGCGSLGSEEDRESLLNRLSPLCLSSSARISSDSGALYQFVSPSVIVQVKVTDLQTERSDGSLSLGHRVELTTEGWLNRGMAPTARLIHPVLLRIRNDKEVNPHDLRLSQLDEFVSIQTKGSKLDTGPAKSQILRRDVWVKETKGVKTVRKLLVWKTNKEVNDHTMPAFVVHWTDYSPNRAAPLDREVKLAPTKESAMAIAEQLISENIKKGWEKV